MYFYFYTLRHIRFVGIKECDTQKKSLLKIFIQEIAIKKAIVKGYGPEYL